MSSIHSISWFLKTQDRPFRINHDTMARIWAIVARENYQNLTDRVNKLWPTIADFINYNQWSPPTLTHYPAYTYLKPGVFSSRAKWAIDGLEKLMVPYFRELAKPPLDWRVVIRDEAVKTPCGLPEYPRVSSKTPLFHFPKADEIQKAHKAWVKSLEPTDVRDWDINQTYHKNANKPQDL